MPPPVSPNNVVMLAQGTEVEIDGLLRRPDFNGRTGIVQSWDPMLRRYDVLLDMGVKVKTKRENLRLRPPPPPPSAAAFPATTIDLSSCLPMSSEDGLQQGSGELVGLDVTSLSPTMAPDSAGWYPWQYCDQAMSPRQYCDQGMSPHSWHETAKVDDDIDMSTSAETFGGPSPTWEYSETYSPTMLTFNEAVPGFDSPESAGWLQQPLCDTGTEASGW